MVLFNPQSQDDVQRLNTAIDNDKTVLEDMYRSRRECLIAYQGPRFSRGIDRITGGGDRVSINLMGIAIDLYEQLLAGESIGTLITPRFQEVTALSHSLKQAGDILVEAIDLSETIRSWVKEAMWGCGVLKVGLSFSRKRIRGGGGSYNRKIAMPYADLIDFEDLILDTSAQKWERMRYIGNEYLVPLDWAKEEKSFLASERNELQPATQEDTLRRASSSPTNRHNVGKGIFEMTILRDVYLPWDDTIMTMGKRGPKKPLRVERYKGTTLYHLMNFETVPDTVIPKPLAWDWIDAHKAVNVLYNKAVRQHQSSKVNPLVPPGAEKDAERILAAEDRRYVPVATAQGRIDVFSMPGADPNLINFIGQLIDVFSYISGNINLLGGLSSQSPTLGQDQILAGGGSRRMAELQRRSKKRIAGVIQSLMWYLFKSKNLDVSFERQVGRASVTSHLKHEDIKGRYMEFNFNMEPIRHKSPDERLGLLLTWLQKGLIPLRAEMAQSGQRIDMEELNNIVRDYGDIPELDRVLRKLGRGPTPEEMASLNGKASSPNSQKTQVRRREGGNQPLLNVPAGKSEAGVI